MNYKQLPFGKYMEIKDILLDGTPWTEQQPRLIAIINDMTEDEVLNLKLSKYQELTETLEFLAEPPHSNNCPKKIKMNGQTYEVIKNSKELTAAQFLDYQTYISMKDYAMLPYVLSVVIIPEGKNYGEYDMDEVIDNIKNYLDTDTAFGIFSFFHRAFLKSTRRMLLYLETLMTMLRKKQQNEEMREKMMEAEEEIARLRTLLKNGGFSFS